MELFAIAVRTHKGITGIETGQMEQNVALNADDVILYISNLKKSIPDFLELIIQFSKIWGYTINKSRSSILLLNKEKGECHLPIELPFKVVDQLTYLGIQIRSDLDSVVNINYTPLMREIIQLIDGCLCLLLLE